MPWPKGRKHRPETIAKQTQTLQRTKLRQAREQYRGTEELPTKSKILWDTLCLREYAGRQRRAVQILCGLCQKTRWLLFDPLIPNKQAGAFTGYCHSCAGKLISPESHQKGAQIWQLNQLEKAKQQYQGDEVLSTGSIIHWDTLCLREFKSRRRRAIQITCGICRKPRWLEFANLIKSRRRNTFTGYCKKCFAISPWAIKMPNRKRKGKYVDPAGYVQVYVGKDHPVADCRGCAREHRLVMAEHLGRSLKQYEHVHHINGDRADNRLENLALLPEGDHGVIKDMQAYIKLLEDTLRKHRIPIPTS